MEAVQDLGHGGWAAHNAKLVAGQSMLPASAATRQPSVVECWISMAHPLVVAGRPLGFHQPRWSQSTRRLDGPTDRTQTGRRSAAGWVGSY